MPTKKDNVLKFGRNADVDAGTEDVWDGGGVWVAPTQARVHAIVSGSANDTSAGTGARTISVQGLDSSYNLQSETVTMNGATPVNTANSYTIIHRMQVLTAGSGAANAGAITATAATDGTVTAQISTGEGQTLMAIYQVPAGYQAYLRRYYASVGGVTSASTCSIRLRVKDFGGAWCTKHTQELVVTGSNAVSYNYGDMALIVNEKSIIKIDATSGAPNEVVGAGFDLELMPILS